MTEELKQLREALRRVKHEAASLADAQVIALEALTQRPAAQADDHSEQLTKAKRLLVDLHKIGGEDVRTLIEARTGPWFVWGQDRASLPTQPAAQATPEPSRHPLFAASVAARKWAELQEKGHRMQSLQFDGGPGGAGSIDPWGKVMWATPEPVGEPALWVLTMQLDQRETTTWGYLWFSNPQNDSWTPLFTRPAPGVPAKLPSAYATSTEDGTWRVLLAFDNKDDAEATRRFLHDHGVQPRTMRSSAPGVPEDSELLDYLDTLATRAAGSDLHCFGGRVALYVRTGIGSQIEASGAGTAREAIRAALAAAQAKGADK